MAAVPSAGCLLAKNQYYRTRLNSDSSVSSSSSFCCSESMTSLDQEKPLHGLPEVFDKCWWIKSFFHCDSVPQNVGRKTLSASRWLQEEKPFEAKMQGKIQRSKNLSSIILKDLT